MSPGLALTYLLTFGGAVVGLFNPFLGLLIYIGFAILKPESLWYWSVPEANYSRIVASSLLVGWLMQQFGRWRQRYPDLSVQATLLTFCLHPFVLLGSLITGRSMQEFGRERAMVGALLLFMMLAIV